MSFYIISIIGVIVILIITLYFTLKIHKNNSHIDRFLDKVGIITGIVGAMGIYMTYILFKLNIEDQQMRRHKFVTLVGLFIILAIISYYIKFVK